MKQNEACVPINERPSNEVDKLLQQVEKIQRNCQHDLRLTERPNLPESEIKDVFVALNEDGHPRGQVTMTLRCMNCSVEYKITVTSTCLQCLSDMEDIPMLKSREKYFGRSHLYFAARLRRCGNCGFTIVSDEWDQ